MSSIIHGRYSKTSPEFATKLALDAARESHERLTRQLERVIFRRLDLLAASLDRYAELREKADAAKSSGRKRNADMAADEAMGKVCVELSRLAYKLSCECLDWLRDDAGPAIFAGGDFNDYWRRYIDIKARKR